MKNRQNVIKSIILLWIGIIIFSFCGVMSKLASGFPFLSISWMLWYMCGLFLLGIYALIWQQVLKDITLVVAYSHRAMTTALTVVWGIFFFGEKFQWKTFIGISFIIIGIIIVSTGKGSNEGRVRDD